MQVYTKKNTFFVITFKKNSEYNLMEISMHNFMQPAAEFRPVNFQLSAAMVDQFETDEEL